MSSLPLVRLVMSREIRQRVRSRAFVVTTVLLCIGVLGAGVLRRALSGDDRPTRYDVATLGARPNGFDEAIRRAAEAIGVEIHLEVVTSRVEAERAVRDGDADAVVDVDAVQLLSEKEPPERLVAVVSSAWQAARAAEAASDAGLSPDEATSILAPAPLRSDVLDPDTSDDDTVASVVGLTAAVLLFISINAFGGMVLTGVVEEKSTGVVEVLLAHVRAHQLLAGKVFGIGVVALMQFSAAIAAGIVALRISGTTVPVDVWIGLPATLLWFVGGFVLYSTLFALAGSCVSRQEDAQGAAAPISMLFTAAYLTVFALSDSPGSTAARVVSVLPPFAPLLMPLRVSVGAASVIEIVIAGAGLLVAMLGMLRLAGSVYGRTLLHRGARLRWKQALRMRGT